MPPFTLTRAHVLAAFAPLAETHNLAVRGTFFTHFSPDVVWTCTGSAHALAGTRRSLRAHIDATFDRLAPRLSGPITFTVVRVLIDTRVPETAASPLQAALASASSAFPSSSPSASSTQSSPPSSLPSSSSSSSLSSSSSSSSARPSSASSSHPASPAQPPQDLGQWASVELRGVATRKASGEPYINDYLWLTRWNQQGLIDHVRSYHDTMLAEEVLRGA